MFDATRIQALLAELDDELQHRGVRGELFVVGGAAMALAYTTWRSTRDIDAVFEPKQAVYDAAAAVAANHHDVPADWLNDAVKGLMLGADPASTVVYSTAGLNVRVASPGYLFAMKAVAARVERDADDLVELYRLMGFTSAHEAFRFLESTFPAAGLLPRTQYLIEDIAGAVATESGLPPEPDQVETERE